MASAHHPVHYRSAYLSATAINIASGGDLLPELCQVESQKRLDDRIAQRPNAAGPSGTGEQPIQGLIDGRNLEKQLDSQFLPESLRHLLDGEPPGQTEPVSHQQRLAMGIKSEKTPAVCDPNIISSRNKYSIEPDLPDELLESGDSDKEEFPTVVS